MKHLLVVISAILLFSCQKKETTVVEEEKPVEKEFEMYQMSEMAALMEQMYVDNLRLKEQIINGEAIGKFPDHFLKIHNAVLTEEDDKDDFFNEQAKIFIETQELIYTDPVNAKEHFNKGVDACITCHEQKCTGPIPRIKKLYIK
jgi:cytochrome c553